MLWHDVCCAFNFRKWILWSCKTMNDRDLPATNEIRKAAKNTNSNMKISLTLSLLNVKVEYELLVLCGVKTFFIALPWRVLVMTFFFWKGKGSKAENISALLLTWIAALVTFFSFSSSLPKHKKSYLWAMMFWNHLLCVVFLWRPFPYSYYRFSSTITAIFRFCH